MCRDIKTLFNFEPPATELEGRAASLQFVRRLSGFNVPSKADEAALERAVEEVAASARRMIQALLTHAGLDRRGGQIVERRAPSQCWWSRVMNRSMLPAKMPGFSLP